MWNANSLVQDFELRLPSPFSTKIYVMLWEPATIYKTQCNFMCIDIHWQKIKLPRSEKMMSILICLLYEHGFFCNVVILEPVPILSYIYIYIYIYIIYIYIYIYMKLSLWTFLLSSWIITKKVMGYVLLIWRGWKYAYYPVGWQGSNRLFFLMQKDKPSTEGVLWDIFTLFHFILFLAFHYLF